MKDKFYFLHLAPDAVRAWMVFVFFFCINVFSVKSASYYYVAPAGTNNFPYTNWNDASTNIQWAVDVATNGDTVWVSNGVYLLTNQIVVTNSIILQSLNGSTSAVVNGNGITRCFWISNVNALITGFTITNGYMNITNDGKGGGAFLGSGCLSNCIITGNMVTNFLGNISGGGGVYCLANARVDACRLEGNVVVTTSAVPAYAGGGGAYLKEGGTLTNCEITGNLADVPRAGSWCGGGGVYFYFSGGAIDNCRINSNKAFTAYSQQAGGGGIFMEYGGRVYNSTIIGNTNDYGAAGGVAIQYDGTLRNCIISRNTKISHQYGVIGGNGVFVRAKANIENCTIMDNRGAGEAGIYYFEYASIWPAIFVNTIVQSNYSDGGLTNWYFIDSTNLCVSNCCMNLTNFPAKVQSSGCITNDPRCVDFAGGNYRLNNDSPCINAGIIQSWMTTGVDLDGRTRIRYGRVDMGAYERILEGTIYRFR